MKGMVLEVILDSTYTNGRMTMQRMEKTPWIRDGHRHAHCLVKMQVLSAA